MQSKHYTQATLPCCNALGMAAAAISSFLTRHLPLVMAWYHQQHGSLGIIGWWGVRGERHNGRMTRETGTHASVITPGPSHVAAYTQLVHFLHTATGHLEKLHGLHRRLAGAEGAVPVSR